MLLLDKEAIKKSFSMKDAIEADKLAFSLASEGRVDIPLRTVIQVPDRDASYIFMPAYSADMDAASVKIVNVFPHNSEKGLDTCPGQIILCDENGQFIAMLDGTYITQIRTGAASGAAIDILARKTCRTGGLIGTGSQAAAQLEAMLTARRFEEVKVYSRNREKLEQFCSKMTAELKDYGAKITPASGTDEICECADVIVTVTSSHVPVFDGSKVKEGCTVCCAGSYLPDMAECDPVLMQRASKIICDLKSAALAESGDLIIPLDKGMIDEAKITGSLGDVINGRTAGRENDDEIIVFETVGIGAQDLVASKLIYDNAVKNGYGVTFGE